MLGTLSVDITTAAGGTSTDYVGLKVTGKIWAIQYTFVDMAATVDFTITGETTGLPVLTVADVAQADTAWFPRIVPNKQTDASAFTNESGEPPRVCGERIKVATAGGGDTKQGTLTFYIEDDQYLTN